jgi:iron-regulated transporter 1
LFVSLLTTTVSYPFSVAFFLGLAIVTLCFELVWIAVVYRQFETLAGGNSAMARASQPSPPQLSNRPDRWKGLYGSIKESLYQQKENFSEFASLPIFLSTLPLNLVDTIAQLAWSL